MRLHPMVSNSTRRSNQQISSNSEWHVAEQHRYLSAALALKTIFCWSKLCTSPMAFVLAERSTTHV
eukprot:6486769-Amphidinium_carterae.1